MDKQRQPGIRIAQIYLEQAKFSHRADHLEHGPHTPLSPVFDLSFTSAIAPDKKSGRVRARVSTIDDASQLYQFEVEVTAILEQIEGEENLSLETYLSSNGWALLFPFVRENIANITSRGRFGPVWLNPLNILAVVQSPDSQLPARSSEVSPQPALGPGDMVDVPTNE